MQLLRIVTAYSGRVKFDAFGSQNLRADSSDSEF